MRYLAGALIPLFSGVLAAQSALTVKAGAEEYPVHAKLDKLSIGAEYLVHSFSAGRETFIARDYLVVEVALFPAKDQTLDVNAGQFTLRMNGKKQTLSPQAPEFVAASLTHPEWNNHPQAVAGVGPVIFGAPSPSERFPGDPQGRTAPTPRAPQDDPSGLGKAEQATPAELAVQTALPEGEHQKPVAGYVYFAYQGKIKHIRSLELEYAGPAGTATLQLQ